MTDNPQPVTVVGTGAIGTAVVRALVAAGRPVTVWNRNSARADEAVDAGARLAASLDDAVSASPLSLLTLTDYDAVRSVLDAVGVDLADRTVVALCTGDADDALSAADRAATLGADYLDGGVQAAPEDIGGPTGTIVYAGRTDVFEHHRPTLELLGQPRYAGAEPTAAAVFDLALFGIWYDAQIGLLRALGAIADAGGDLATFADAATTQLAHVATAADETATEVDTASYRRGPADLTEHLPVVDRLIALRSKQRLGDGGLSEVRDTITALVAEGRGSEGMTALLRRRAPIG